ncbi:MarR family winged helix-turn-helix transcriptional regulator [Amycolatopsis sp.]|uniref:MarR family winged helix-turn-helix transcriptional regulator n=1 Tax=Amycolatopsis sp. TaxID=37632 RepID=UPI002CF98D91|nr:MarR family transcriptional regulator [Amycolatopsis sp.]HVV11723.1 MarR family transcriptional regulator [Amycolatopsis sp.]
MSLSEDQFRGWLGFLGAHTLVERTMERYLHESAGVSHAEYEILARLGRVADGRMRMGALASALFSPGSRLNYRVTRLAGLGLVRREQHPTDRRGLYAVLTDEGRAFLDRISPGYLEKVRYTVLGVLTEAEFAQLCALSDKLLRGLGEA